MRISSALGGTLERRHDGWYWRTGEREPEVRDMLLSEIAPNFRCTNHGGITYVEIPARWQDARYWPNGRVDAQAASEIDTLIQQAGKRAPIYLEGLAEALDDHRLTGDGWLVDIAQWDAVMRELVGCWWDKRDEERIFARARELGYLPT